jgi:hypothetical protein
MINENTLDSQQIERLQQIALNTQKVLASLSGRQRADDGSR